MLAFRSISHVNSSSGHSFPNLLYLYSPTKSGLIVRICRELKSVPMDLIATHEADEWEVCAQW